jgi:hypothetical protein
MNGIVRLTEVECGLAVACGNVGSNVVFWFRKQSTGGILLTRKPTKTNPVHAVVGVPANDSVYRVSTFYQRISIWSKDVAKAFVDIALL